MCGKLSQPQSGHQSSGASSSTTDPFDDFKPFLESISETVAAVLQIPFFDHLYGPIERRQSVLFHLHFKMMPAASTGSAPQARFRLDDPVREVTPGVFLDWVEKTVPGAEPVLPQYARMFAEIKASDERRRDQAVAAAREARTTPATDRDQMKESSTTEPVAMVRLICTAQSEVGKFLGLRTSVVTLPTRTRSGLDPRNRGLAFDTVLRTLINDPPSKVEEAVDLNNEDERHRARGLALLKRVVKEFSRDDNWLQRAHESTPVRQWPDQDQDQDQEEDPWDDVGLASRAIQLGVDEKVMLGGRDRKAFIYAVPVPGQSSRRAPRACHVGWTARPA